VCVSVGLLNFLQDSVLHDSARSARFTPPALCRNPLSTLRSGYAFDASLNGIVTRFSMTVATAPCSFITRMPITQLLFWCVWCLLPLRWFWNLASTFRIIGLVPGKFILSSLSLGFPS